MWKTEGFVQSPSSFWLCKHLVDVWNKSNVFGKNLPCDPSGTLSLKSWRSKLALCSFFFSFWYFPSSFSPLSLSSWWFAGPPGACAAGILPELGELGDVRPHPGRRHLPHGADTILDPCAHVGRQLSHSGAPPRGRPDLRLQQDPQFTQHEKSQPGRGTLKKAFEGRPELNVSRRGRKCVDGNGVYVGLLPLSLKKKKQRLPRFLIKQL